MMWNKLLKGFAIIAVVLAVVLIIGLPFCFFAYQGAENTMDPEGILSLYEQEDGALRLEWPAGENVGEYTVEVRQVSSNEVLFTTTATDECSCILPLLPEDEELSIRISTSQVYLESYKRPGTEVLETELTLTDFGITELSWSINQNANLVYVYFNMDDGDVCSIYRADTGKQLVETEERTTILAFGEEEKLQMPISGEPINFVFRVTRQIGNTIFHGSTCATLSVSMEDFLGNSMTLSCKEAGNNSYTLTWSETKGETYEVQISEDRGVSWQTITTVEAHEDRIFTTDHLGAFDTYLLRVITSDGEAYAQTTVTTSQQPIYSTIWPLMDQKVYAESKGSKTIGMVSAGDAFCVLEEANGRFAIRFEDGIGYINSDYCMINLPEYVGDLCSYDIVNSYAALYMVHEFGIDKVSGTIIKGYEDVDLGNDEYLVPLLYPAAQKLITAAQTAREQGYRLKIYDSFRPHEASKSIYSLTGKIIDDLVPRQTFSGMEVTDIHELDWEYEGDSAGTSGGSEDYLMEGLTYKILMTNDGKYRLSNFLAPSVSKHNLGIAMDLTLETLYSEELQMQTSIHDLSWYSEVNRNNGAAELLQNIMVRAGFGTLSSEWWHFQDNEALAELGLESLENGVSAECWMKDDNGWRYRQADGQYLKDCTKKIDGTPYTFNADGYVVEE